MRAYFINLDEGPPDNLDSRISFFQLQVKPPDPMISSANCETVTFQVGRFHGQQFVFSDLVGIEHICDSLVQVKNSESAQIPAGMEVLIEVGPGYPHA